MELERVPDRLEKLLAAAAYAGLFIGNGAGILLALVPLVMRDSVFAVYHAKNALVLFGAYLVVAWSYAGAFVFFMPPLDVFRVEPQRSWPGLGVVPLAVLGILLFAIIGACLHGVFLALRGQMRSPIGVFSIGQRLFRRIRVEQRA